jgi:hypothetical protein
MPASSARAPLLLVGVISLGAMAWCLGGIGRGAPPIEQARAGGNPNRGPVMRYRLATQCGNCHRPGYEDRDKYGELLIQFEELRGWRDRDKHHYAFQALTTERGRRMGELLQTDVTKDAACLNCHAPGYKAQAEQELAKSEGVSCYACHSSVDNDKWYGAHSDLIEKWRDKSMEAKEKDFGLLAIRNPVRRAEICLSCHVGNADDGKVLTHDMYAAGHPPLPGFETATFSLTEPPHWWAPSEVPAFKDAKVEFLKNFDAQDPGLHNTKMLLIGSVVALRETMELIAAQAEAAAGGPAWPEYAHFECYACHHDLKAPGYRQWRQVRGYPGQAGRPQLRPWPTALLWLAIRQAGGGREAQLQDQLAGALNSLYQTTDLQVFGAAPDIARDAGKLAKWADDLLTKVDVSKLRQDDLPRLLYDLVSIPEDAYPDYDTARQIAWAFSIIYPEWDGDRKRAIDGEIQKILPRLQRLKLDPFAFREQWENDSQLEDKEEAQQAHNGLSQSELLQSLFTAADYEPQAFKADLRRLADLLIAR